MKELLVLKNLIMRNDLHKIYISHIAPFIELGTDDICLGKCANGCGQDCKPGCPNGCPSSNACGK